MKTIPARYTCAGDNISPPLSIDGVPDNTQSLALILHDPDAAAGRDFIHWVVWGISPGTREILEDSAPSGSSEGINDFGRVGYGGPCPHKGEHRYIFELFALDIVLDLPSTTGAKQLNQAMKDHIIAQDRYVGLVKKASS